MTGCGSASSRTSPGRRAAFRTVPIPSRHIVRGLRSTRFRRRSRNGNQPGFLNLARPGSECVGQGLVGFPLGSRRDDRRRRDKLRNSRTQPAARRPSLHDRGNQASGFASAVARPGVAAALPGVRERAVRAAVRRRRDAGFERAGDPDGWRRRRPSVGGRRAFVLDPRGEGPARPGAAVGDHQTRFSASSASAILARPFGRKFPRLTASTGSTRSGCLRQARVRGTRRRIRAAASSLCRSTCMSIRSPTPRASSVSAARLRRRSKWASSSQWANRNRRSPTNSSRRRRASSTSPRSSTPRSAFTIPRSSARRSG